jgi:3',5'-cyclic AMP phosphodiesterase CpdA
LKIAHFSDLHFSHFLLSPLQFFSKTWIGNANLILKRGQRLQPLKAESVKEILKEIKPDLCIFSGDFTTTSQPKEYEKAKDFIADLDTLGIPLLKIPGNHDHYTKKAFKKKLFYSYLTNNSLPKLAPFSLKSHGFEIYPFPDCTIILMDQTEATPWFTAYGQVTKNQCDQISDALSSIDFKKPCIFVGHFPLFNHKNSRFHKALKGSSDFIHLLSTHSPCFYLHGHNHDLRVLKHDVVTQIDSGSLSDVQKGSFVVLDTQTGNVTPFMRKGETFTQGSTLL